MQTVANTPVVIDETLLGTGKLGDTGVKNISALNQLILHQTVTYDFGFYSNEWKVNVPVLVIASGKKSVLSSVDCLLPVKATYTPTIPPQIISPGVYAMCRKYLATVRSMKTRPFDISDSMARNVEKDFVNLRQLDREISEGDLHRRLNLARFVELSYGSSECTERGWSTVQRLEGERMQRNKIAGTKAGILQV